MSIFNHNSLNSENVKNAFQGDNYSPVLALKELVASLQKEQNKIQNLLSSLSFALRSFNNLNQFLELTPLMVARVTDADGGALILYGKNNNIKLEQIYCQNNQYRDKIFSSFEGVVEDINSYQKQLEKDINSLPHIDSFSSFVQDKFEEKLSLFLNIFSTPILIKNTERGRLYIFSQDSEYLWTQTRKKLAQLVADQTAVAIANHELTVELRSKERQDRELEIASEIQSRLLPRKCPIIKGLQIAAKCETANRVGGDYYDFIPVNYDQWSENSAQIANAPCEPWSIVIGDVMGKGVPAGLIMTMTRGMLRAEVLNRHSPARVLEHLNRVMYADLENSHRFVTLFYSEYDPQSQILRYANAAHNPPLLWREREKKILRLDTEGMLIGLQSNSEYKDKCINLELNDIILYYTDGLTDAVNQNNQRFEEDNLHISFDYACQNYDCADDILHHIFREIQNFIGVGHKNTDDMTLIVVKFDPNDSIVCGVNYETVDTDTSIKI
ncbi:GAF domain-containing SpoIIE family protein phosphatase [Geminocystis sp. NIES-3709]|uniref:GAF domain-containing SpoIIE family protein phosphatase n=1 Tax=Geminocystis sp. NIES-3709 TaxID=1617448 RepID=UPI0005FC4E01|nr:GAF domain-containing SpoIIE family protein phosphatase [Geminocystis sp. NIES-3709]BAQ64941.1 serine phosphatase RsbU [Geminocystis sp. NIES-3709]